MSLASREGLAHLRGTIAALNPGRRDVGGERCWPWAAKKGRLSTEEVEVMGREQTVKRQCQGGARIRKIHSEVSSQTAQKEVAATRWRAGRHKKRKPPAVHTLSPISSSSSWPTLL